MHYGNSHNWWLWRAPQRQWRLWRSVLSIKLTWLTIWFRLWVLSPQAETIVTVIITFFYISTIFLLEVPDWKLVILRGKFKVKLQKVKKKTVLLFQLHLQLTIWVRWVSQFDRKNGPKSGVGTKRLSSPSAPRPDTMDKILSNSPFRMIVFKIKLFDKNLYNGWAVLTNTLSFTNSKSGISKITPNKSNKL